VWSSKKLKFILKVVSLIYLSFKNKNKKKTHVFLRKKNLVDNENDFRKILIRLR
jgi:hypothetical protein